MPINPSRSSQGGDVEGTANIFVTQGVAIPVSKASFDPGYTMDNALENTLSDADCVVSKADLITGYCTYGKVIGERE